MNFLFHHKVLYLIEIYWLLRPFGYNKISVTLKKPAGDDSSFVSWCVIRLKVAIRRCYTVFVKGWTCSGTTKWTVNDAQVVLKGSKCSKKMPVCTFIIMLEANLRKEINTVGPVHTDLQVFCM